MNSKLLDVQVNHIVCITSNLKLVFAMYYGYIRVFEVTIISSNHIQTS